MIVPTVGRVLWFYQYVEGQGHKGPTAAHVAAVHDDGTVNLMVISTTGEPRAQQNVVLNQSTAIPSTDYCEWPPHPKAEAAKTDDLKETLKKSISKAKTKKGKKK